MLLWWSAVCMTVAAADSVSLKRRKVNLFLHLAALLSFCLDVRAHFMLTNSWCDQSQTGQ